MNHAENINAPKVNTFIPYGVTDKLFTGGALYFIDMKRTRFSNTSGIYQIQSKINNKRYIGSAVIFRKRKILHICSLVNQKHYNIHLQRHVNKHGMESLIFSILEFCPKEKLIEREQYYIDALKPEFNFCTTAGSTLGIHYSEEAKRKISISKMGNSWNRGRIHTEQAKQNMRKPKSAQAKLNMKNKEFTKEHRHNLSIAAKKRENLKRQLKKLINGK